MSSNGRQDPLQHDDSLRKLSFLRCRKRKGFGPLINYLPKMIRTNIKKKDVKKLFKAAVKRTPLELVKDVETIRLLYMRLAANNVSLGGQRFTVMVRSLAVHDRCSFLKSHSPIPLAFMFIPSNVPISL